MAAKADYSAKELPGTGPDGAAGATLPGDNAKYLRNRLAETLRGANQQTSYSPIVVAGLVRLTEFLLACISGLAVYKMYVVPAAGEQSAYYLVIPAMAAAAIIVFQALHINTTPAFRTPAFQVLKLAGSWGFVFLSAMATIFFLKRGEEFSRVWLLAWFVSGLVLLISNRIVVFFIVRFLTRRGRLDRRAVIVGGGNDASPCCATYPIR